MGKDLNYLGALSRNVNQIDASLFDTHNIKQGLRNKDKTGVQIGLTKVGNVIGYEYIDGKKCAVEGKLFYRDMEISDLLKTLEGKNLYFERSAYLLMFGKLPNDDELDAFMNLIYEYSKEYIYFGADSINLMNVLQQDISKLYSYDDEPELITHEKIIEQSLRVFGYFPDMILQGFLHGDFNKKKSRELKAKKLGVARYFLSMLNDREYSDQEVRLFDELLFLHLEHGGGNNSTFTVRVVTSAYTDTYSAMVAGICSLKGKRHGGANVYVSKMIRDIKENIDYNDYEELKAYLKRILNKEVFDKSGLIYGMGHAVYTISDPRAKILKNSAEKLSKNMNCEKEFKIYSNIEEITKELFLEKNLENPYICANVDLYSGFVNNMLGIDESLYTPIFAMARILDWSAHRAEQLFTDKKILRPGYKTL